MSIYTIRDRWGMGPKVDPHFDARVGRMAATPETTDDVADGSGYIELDADNPWQYLQQMLASLYGETSPMQGVAGVLDTHERPLAWTEIRKICYLTTDAKCGVALPMQDFMPPPVGKHADFASAIAALRDATSDRLKDATQIGLTVVFRFEVIARTLKPVFKPGVLKRMLGAGRSKWTNAHVQHLLFGGTRPASPLRALARGVGERPFRAQRLGLAGLVSPQLSHAMRLLQRPSPPDPSGYGMSATGKDTILGIVDFGCDFAHPSFRTGEGHAASRILALWDQNESDDPVQRPPMVDIAGTSCSFGYGRLFRRADLQEALEHPDPYAHLRYDPDENHYIPNPDDGAHGTVVMEVAAGGFRTVGLEPGDSPPRGVAPDADIVFVQVRLRQRDDGRRILDMNDVLDAVAFIFHTAESANRPCVVNLSLNTMSGPHDGDGYFDRRLSSLLRSGNRPPETRIPACGRAVVVAAGNVPEPGAQKSRWPHLHGRVPSPTKSAFRWRMGPNDRTRNAVEIWYDARDAWLQVKLITPDQQEIGPVKPGRAAELMVDGKCRGSIIGSRLMPELDEDGLLLQGPEVETDEAPGRHVILLQLEPLTLQREHWTVILELVPRTGQALPAGAEVEFHAWLERDDEGPSGLNWLPPAEPIDEPDRQCTVGTLSCGADAIVVSAFSTGDGLLGPWGLSGQGPSRRGTVHKPDLAAPGHDVCLVRSRHGDGASPTLAVKSGTSIAAPFVAGTIACIYECAPDAPLEEVRKALTETAIALSDDAGKDLKNELGHGCLHPQRALACFQK